MMTKLSSKIGRKRLPARLADFFLRLLLPVNCLGCGEEGEWVCPDCLSKLHLSRPIICVICSRAGDDGLCDQCRQRTELDGVVSLFAYKDPAAQRLVKKLKYSGQTDAGRFIMSLGADIVSSRLPQNDWSVVPIPLSAQRLKERGFNQAEVLGREYGQAQDLRVWRGLIRFRHTDAQTLLGKKERSENVKNCFAVQSTVPEAVLLFDDVVTTGSTLKEATTVLRNNGAKTVWAVTIAHG